MFSKIRNRKNLKRRSSANHAEVGFIGRAAKIAMIHQEGEIAEVSPGGPLAKYAQRQLLGYTRQDMDEIEKLAAAHLSK